MNCPLCQQTLNPAYDVTSCIYCGGQFHLQCVDEWWNASNECFCKHCSRQWAARSFGVDTFLRLPPMNIREPDALYTPALLRAFGIVDENIIRNVSSRGVSCWELLYYLNFTLDGQEHASDAFVSPSDLMLIGFSEDVSKFVFDHVFRHIDRDHYFPLHYVAKMYMEAFVDAAAGQPRALQKTVMPEHTLYREFQQDPSVLHQTTSSPLIPRAGPATGNMFVYHGTTIYHADDIVHYGVNPNGMASDFYRGHAFYVFHQSRFACDWARLKDFNHGTAALLVFEVPISWWINSVAQEANECRRQNVHRFDRDDDDWRLILRQHRRSIDRTDEECAQMNALSMRNYCRLAGYMRQGVRNGIPYPYTPPRIQVAIACRQCADYLTTRLVFVNVFKQ